jgi:predicted GNAT superfamily acetyltransferase
MDSVFATDVPAAGSDLESRLVELNNINAVMLAWMEPERFRELAAASFALLRAGGAEAFLLAFDETAAYDGFNFRWFAARYPRFVYIDRVVVAEAARGRGIGQALYAELFRRARASGRSVVTLEINADPPNPGSLRFHTRLGFTEVGAAETPSGKAVTYHVRDLGVA